MYYKSIVNDKNRRKRIDENHDNASLTLINERWTKVYMISPYLALINYMGVFSGHSATIKWAKFCYIYLIVRFVSEFSDLKSFWIFYLVCCVFQYFYYILSVSYRIPNRIPNTCNVTLFLEVNKKIVIVSWVNVA